jgi:hypothetical protein
MSTNSNEHSMYIRLLWVDSVLLENIKLTPPPPKKILEQTNALAYLAGVSVTEEISSISLL